MSLESIFDSLKPAITLSKSKGETYTVLIDEATVGTIKLDISDSGIFVYDADGGLIDSAEIICHEDRDFFGKTERRNSLNAGCKIFLSWWNAMEQPIYKVAEGENWDD